MSNPVIHAERSAKKWGGSANDYLALHQWFDATKGHLPDNRHRMLLHNSFGMLLAEQVFGPVIRNSLGRRVFVRDLAALHIIEDLGFIPTVFECLADLPLESWMAGAARLIPRPILTSPLLADPSTASVG
ncbi:MAG: hypothetical protein JWM11_969 [Planctomycetaceae bacterium]|nr:hypothetical protein [Planctomycetaceae bacterium]